MVTRGSTAWRRGVVLIDVIMMLAVLGIVLLAFMPSAHPGESMKLVAASTVLSADIEYAQSETLARPSDPTVVRFDAAGGRYWLARESEPDTPIVRPNGKDAYEVEFGHGAYRDLWGMEVAVEGMADATLQFDAMGRLVVSSDGVIRFGNETGEIAVVVRATTGSVSIRDGADVPHVDAVVPEEEPPPAEGTGGTGAGPAPLGGSPSQPGTKTLVTPGGL